MKKARIMLASLAVLVVAATSFAFTAKKITGFYLFSLDEAGVCKRVAPQKHILTTGTAGFVVNDAYTTSNSTITTTAQTLCAEETLRVTIEP